MLMKGRGEARMAWTAGLIDGSTFYWDGKDSDGGSKAGVENQRFGFVHIKGSRIL